MSICHRRFQFQPGVVIRACPTRPTTHRWLSSYWEIPTLKIFWPLQSLFLISLSFSFSLSHAHFLCQKQVCYWSGSLLINFFVNLAVKKADARHSPNKHEPFRNIAYILCRLWALIFCLWVLKNPMKHNVLLFLFFIFFLTCHNIPQKKKETLLIKLAVARKCQRHLKNNLTAEVKILIIVRQL